MIDGNDIIALAERITTLPAYSEEQLGFKFVPHGDAPKDVLSGGVMIIGANQRGLIVNALRFYAHNRRTG